MNDVAIIAPLDGPVVFPSTYLAARIALAKCERIDECQEWANKSLALSAYAHQARDETLLAMASRIQARAVRRCGELLKATPINRTAFANASGLTRLQRNQAVSVAQIPAPKFEALVESQKPPKVYRLAALGRRKRAGERREQSPPPRVHQDCPSCTCCKGSS